MSVRNVCDKCGKDLVSKNKKLPRLIAKRGWKFLTETPTEEGFTDLSYLNKKQIDLCQTCTKAFFAFITPKPPKPKKNPDLAKIGKAVSTKKGVAVSVKKGKAVTGKGGRYVRVKG